MDEIKCKKLVNHPGDAVRESLIGFVQSQSPLLQLTSKHNIILRSDLSNARNKVLLLSGGGSGHEPTFGGFVGEGMLSATVAGEIFTSPGPESILAALRILGKYTNAGIIIIINNYTGDRLNFGLAMNRARAEGINVDMLVNHDDCALQSQDKSAGRRGVAGCLLAIKIAGAMAEDEKNMTEIMFFCSKLLDNIGTIGIGLSGCSIPGVGSSFVLNQDEFELGLGIHGEAGIKKLKMGSAKEIVKIMIDHMTDKNSATRFELKAGEKIAILLNNLGGTSQLEINIITKEAVEYLETMGAKVERIIVGTLMTSLEMAGISISILKLDDDVKSYLDFETNAPSWPKCSIKNFSADSVIYEEQTEDISKKNLGNLGQSFTKDQCAKLREIALHICDVICENEQLLNDLDRESGDGDCGSTLKRGFEEIRKFIQTNPNSLTYPKDFLLTVSDLMERSMGGSSGALYSIFCTALAQAFEVIPNIGIHNLKEVLLFGLDDICRFGAAQPGDRTMVDPLHAFILNLSSLKNKQPNECLSAIEKAVIAAEKSASDTSTMAAKAGRASYVDKARLTRPDPGAQAVSIWFRAAFNAWQKQLI